MAEPGRSREDPVALQGRTVLRIAFFGTIVLLSLIRLWLNPPAFRPLILVILTWYVTAGLYYTLRPRGVSGWLPLAVRLAFHMYEVLAVVVVAHHLGGSGWLAILLLLYPVVEVNAGYPGWPGIVASLLAVLASMTIVVAEALGWLPHDPFFSVSDPLYRQPEYVVAVLAVASVTLLAPAIARRRTG